MPAKNDFFFNSKFKTAENALKSRLLSNYQIDLKNSFSIVKETYLCLNVSYFSVSLPPNGYKYEKYSKSTISLKLFCVETYYLTFWLLFSHKCSLKTVFKNWKLKRVQWVENVLISRFFWNYQTNIKTFSTGSRRWTAFTKKLFIFQKAVDWKLFEKKAFSFN